MSDAPGTVIENYFPFDAATTKNGQNWLGQPETIEFRRENTSDTRGTAQKYQVQPAAANIDDGRN